MKPLDKENKYSKIEEGVKNIDNPNLRLAAKCMLILMKKEESK